MRLIQTPKDDILSNIYVEDIKYMSHNQ